MSNDCLADVWCERSLSRGAATPEIEVVLASRASVSLAERAERVERLLDDLCLLSDVGMIEAPP